MKPTKVIALIAALLVVGLVVHRMHRTSQVQDWCSAVPTGASRAEVIATAKAANLDLAADTTGEFVGVRLRLLPVGYAICTVRFNGDEVVSTRYETS